MGGSRCEPGREIFQVNEIQELPILPNKRGRRMRIHIPARAVWIIFNIRVSIKLGEKFFDGGCAQCKSQGLVAVITRIKITGSEKFCNRYLRYFLAISKNAEFCFTRKYFFAAQQAGFTAFTNQPVVFQHFLAEKIER